MEARRGVEEADDVIYLPACPFEKRKARAKRVSEFVQCRYYSRSNSRFEIGSIHVRQECSIRVSFASRLDTVGRH